MQNFMLDRRNLMLGGGAAILGAASSAFAARPVGPGGFSPDRLAKIPATLQRYVDAEAQVGIVTLLYRRGEIAQVNALGWQDLEAKLPMKRDTIFRIASMTKPITCVAALTLVDQGKIGLFDPIDKWIPEFANPKVLNNPNGPLNETHPAPRPITLADLLTHRSGIGGGTSTGPLRAALAGLNSSDPAFDPTFDTHFKSLGAIPLAYDPGAQFLYGTSHDVLGGLIQRISGQSLGDYVKSAICDPLGMKDTGFWLPKEKQNRLAALYRVDPKTNKQVPYPWPIPTAPRNYASGGGGLVSTADDYLRFARMMLGKGRLGDVRILTRPTVALMTTNWLTPEQIQAGFMGMSDFWASQGFGLGVSVTTDVSRLGRMPFTSKGSFGWPGATGVWWCADPAEDLVAIYLVQSLSGIVQPSPAASAIMRVRPAVAFVNQAYEAIET